MFRTVFKSAVRQASLPRAYSTRAARPLNSRNFIFGASLVASSLVFLPSASVDNDADQAKVESDKKSTKLGNHDGKSTYSVENSSNKPSEVIPEDHPSKMPKRKASEKATEEASEKAEKASEKAEKESAEKQNNEEGKEPTEEDESGEQSAAYNPETGEINWDCPCLGGMAHGPCGEEFKAAFSCFIYSETEPKGIDCIQKFEGMRTCFRQHPEHYKEELYEDDEPVPSTGEKQGSDEKLSQDSKGLKKTESSKEAVTQESAATEDISKVA